MKGLACAIGAVIFLILYILFSDPKSPEEKERIRNYRPFFKSSLRGGADYTPEEVFETLKNAGIGPTFMQNEKDKTNS